MKKIHFMAAAVILMATNSALAAPNFYVRGGLGIGSQKVENTESIPSFPLTTKVFNKSGNPLIGELAFGAKYGNVRTELQYHYSKYEEKQATPTGTLKHKLSSVNNGAFLNCFYDVATGTMVTPYVMAGLGFIHSSVEYKEVKTPYTTKKSNTSFAYQAGLGLNFALNKSLDLGVGYKFINKTSDKTNATTTGFGIGAVSNSIKQKPIHAGIIDMTVKF